MPDHRLIPTGRKLAIAMRVILRRQLAEVLPRLRVGTYQAPSLRHWLKPMTETLTPLVKPYFVRGGQESAKRIASLLRRRGKAVGNAAHDRARRILQVASRTVLLSDPGQSVYPATAVIKREAATTALGILFDVFNPRVQEAVDRLTFDFCQETLDTSTDWINRSLSMLREDLLTGLEEGLAMLQLTQRVQHIFADPMRAHRIAQTETSRAMHGGQMLMAQESGIVSKKSWLASSDACDFCKGLMAKGPIPLEEDFAVVGTGTYARIPHPPGHPHCFCTMTEVLTD